MSLCLYRACVIIVTKRNVHNSFTNKSFLFDSICNSLVEFRPLHSCSIVGNSNDDDNSNNCWLSTLPTFTKLYITYIFVAKQQQQAPNNEKEQQSLSRFEAYRLMLFVTYFSSIAIECFHYPVLYYRISRKTWHRKNQMRSTSPHILIIEWMASPSNHVYIAPIELCRSEKD